MTETDLIARAQHLPDLLARDAHLRHRARHLACSFRLQIGETPVHVELRNGAITALTQGPLLMRSWQFALRGDAQAWELYWQPVPPPGFHDILALTKAKRFVLEGELHPFLSNLLVFKDLLALPRSLEHVPS